MRSLILVLFILFNSIAYGYYPQPFYTCCNPYYRDWSFLLYYGKMTNDTLARVVRFDYTLNRDTLYSIEIAKEFPPCSSMRQFLAPIVNTVELRGNLTFLDDTYGTIVEFNPYLAFTWNQFPWTCKLRTIVSLGEGLSYVSKVPYSEEKNSDQPKHLLNFLLLDIAFALPCYPQWELVTRIHHRSGVFGLYHANNTGSTAVGLGLRYRF